MSSALFSPRALARYLYPQDSSVYNLDLVGRRQRIFDDASNCILQNQIDLTAMHRTVINNKTYVSYNDYPTILLLRSLAGHIRKRHHISMSTRDGIVKRVIQTLMDATPMSIIRRDISSFYESIPVILLKNMIVNDSANSDIVRFYLDQFFAVHCNASPIGLPRGIGLTSILAEVLLKEFDSKVKEVDRVYRYFRFSDDILIVSTYNKSNFDEYLQRALPHPLKFNPKKVDHIELQIPNKGMNENRSFSFLGYEFVTLAKYNGRERSREVSVRIAPEKLNRIKSRIHLTYKSLSKNDNWSLFFDRMRYLSSNFRSRRGKININRKRWFAHSGIYYNYKFCGRYQVREGQRKNSDFDCVQLKELDGLNHALLRKYALSGRILLTRRQVDRLRRLSFYQGYSLKIHARFTGEQINLIKGCWLHAG